MALKSFYTDIVNITNYNCFRMDEKFHSFLYDNGWNLFNVKNRQLVKLKDIILDDYQIFKLEEGKDYKGVPTGQTYLDEDGEIIEFLPVSKEECPNRLKYKIGNSNVLISSLRLAKSPALYFPELDLNDYIFSNGFYIFKVDQKWSTKFINLVLRTAKVKNILNNHIYRGIGISAYKDNDLKRLQIPSISILRQKEIVEKVKPLESQIKAIKSKLLSAKQIIDKVFSVHFGFDIESADKKKKELIHYASLEDLANEELKFDISLKYRYIYLHYIKNVSKIGWIELGKVVIVKGGKRLPKGQNITEDVTDYKYIRVDDLGWSGIFDLDNIKYISEKNHLAIKNYIAKESDILLTIVGATVGKCGLLPIELDGENITENFARLIIKNKLEYLPEYVNYCLQSKTSVYQIDEYKGRASQGKLALFRIKKIKIPNINILQQKLIVKEIKTELDKQEILKQQIINERKKIDKIIEDSITSK